jgi:hypothetical protein
MLVVTVLVAAHAGVAPVLAGDASDDAADTDATAEAASTPPCSSPEFRQFDFWLGEWEVHNAAGELQGHNLIDKVQRGCALSEQWRSVRGGSGQSLNWYDPGSGQRLPTPTGDTAELSPE